MISLLEMGNLEAFILKEGLGCVFKEVYSDGSEKLYVEYSGVTVLEICKSNNIVECYWMDNIPRNWISSIKEIEIKIKEFYHVQVS